MLGDRDYTSTIVRRNEGAMTLGDLESLYTTIKEPYGDLEPHKEPYMITMTVFLYVPIINIKTHGFCFQRIVFIIVPELF